MPNREVQIRDVYTCTLGGQVMYWRIQKDSALQPALEWTVVNSGRNLEANRYTESETATIAAMKSLQQPERRVAMKEVNPFMLECFLEWGWVSLLSSDDT